VTVKIGKEEKAFVLSRELLCRQSAYFEKAFGASSSFKEKSINVAPGPSGCNDDNEKS